MNFDNQPKKSLSPLQERALKEAYKDLYALADARLEDHFIFTSSGAEAVNHIVLATYFDVTRKTGKNHYLCGAIDEAPAIMAMSRLQEGGCLFQMIPASEQGEVTQKNVAEMLTPRTALISLSWANGLTGVLQPIEEIAQLCKERGILLHVDASHVLGKGSFSFSECGADVLTFEAPFPGCGGMFIRSGVEISPLILGGNEQGGMRGGSFNAASLIECAGWAKEALSYRDHYSIEVARVRNYFETLIKHELAEAQPLFQTSLRLPHISSILFPKIAYNPLYHLLKYKGVQSALGGNHFQHLHHILKGCGIEPPLCYSGLSFSFSHFTTEEEITEGVSLIAETVNHLKKRAQHLFSEAL